MKGSVLARRVTIDPTLCQWGVLDVSVHPSDPDTHKMVAIQSSKPAFVTPNRGTSDVLGTHLVLRATLSPDNAQTQNEVYWEIYFNGAWRSGPPFITFPAVSGDKRTAKVARSLTNKFPVRIRCINSQGPIKWEGTIWIISSSTTVAFASQDLLEQVIQNVNMGPSGSSSSPGLYIKTDTVTETTTLLPTALFTDPEAPDMTGPNQTDIPGSDFYDHFVSGDPLTEGVQAKWDATRQVRSKVLNTPAYPLNLLPTIPNSVRFWLFQPTSNPIENEDYPDDPLIGNDDTHNNDETFNPYAAGSLGILTHVDAPGFQMPNACVSNPQAPETFELRYHFRAYARAELNGKWYRIGVPALWRVHFLFVRNPATGTWGNNGSVLAEGNDGF
jgi:hypothetical protein